MPGHEAIRNAIHACIVTAFTHYYASAPRGGYNSPQPDLGFSA